MDFWTHPTGGVQKSIGPVNMKCKEAQTLNFGSNIPCPLCDPAFVRFSEDFLRLTHPTGGVQKSIGPVNMKCPEAQTLNFGSNIPCPLCDLAFARFSEDLLRLTHPTGGGPKVHWTC